MFRSITILLGVLFVLYPFSPAVAQPTCGDRETFLVKLEESFAERPIAMGLTNKGAVLEVFASKSGSWTFLVTMPDGVTCVVASGESWESLKAVRSDQVS